VGCTVSDSAQPLDCQFAEGVGGPDPAVGVIDTGGGVTQDQYLPWAAGRTVQVTQGNNGAASHTSAWTRYGWDFGLHYGDAVLLGIPGVVALARGGCAGTNSWDCNSGYGNTVTVRVDDGSCARFEHLSAINVSVGQALTRGQQIGAIGSSGSSTGPHLHYQREDCATGYSMPSAFFEAGIPAGGASVTSALAATGPAITDPGQAASGTNRFFYRDAGGAVSHTFTWGNAGDVPLTGDWNGDGSTEVGLYRPGTHEFFYRSAGGAVVASFSWGNAGDVPLTGDWNGDGSTEVGL
jgi:hypothetical protein